MYTRLDYAHIFSRISFNIAENAGRPGRKRENRLGMTDESFTRDADATLNRLSLSLCLNFLRCRQERMRRMLQVRDGGREILRSSFARIPLRRQVSRDQVGFPRRYRLDRRKFAFFINGSTYREKERR